MQILSLGFITMLIPISGLFSEQVTEKHKKIGTGVLILMMVLGVVALSCALIGEWNYVSMLALAMVLVSVITSWVVSFIH